MKQYKDYFLVRCNGSDVELMRVYRNKQSIQGVTLLSEHNESSHQKEADLIANDLDGHVKHGSDQASHQGSLPHHGSEKQRLIDQFITDSVIQCLGKVEQEDDPLKLFICVSKDHLHKVKPLIENSTLEPILIGKDLNQQSLKKVDSILEDEDYIDKKAA